MAEAGVAFKKKPTDGNMRGIAFAYDPDKCATLGAPKGFLAMRRRKLIPLVAGTGWSSSTGRPPSRASPKTTKCQGGAHGQAFPAPCTTAAAVHEGHRT